MTIEPLQCMKPTQDHKVSFILTAIFVSILITAFYHRTVIFTDALFGDFGDGRLCTLIAEHWYKVFCGKANITELGMFYPVENTLSLSHTLFIYAIPYIPMRLLGINMWYAYKYTMIFYHFIGLFSMYVLCRQKMRLSHFSCWIAMIISLASNYFDTFLHTQLYAQALLPLLALFLWGFFEHAQDSRNKHYLCGFLFVTLFMALLFTDAYIGYFVALFLAIMAFVYIALRLTQKKKVLKRILHHIHSHALFFIGLCVYAGLLLVPFLLVYLSTGNEIGGKSWEELLYYMPTLSNLFTLHPSNFMYGRATEAAMVTGGEVLRGIPWFSFFVFLLATFTLFRSALSSKSDLDKTQDKVFPSLLFLSIASATLLFLLISVKFHGVFSLWYILYKIVPGISALRAVARMIQYLMFPLSLVVAYYLSNLFDHIQFSRIFTTAITMCLVFIFFLESISIYGAGYTKEQNDALLAAVTPPPENCEVLYIRHDDGYSYNHSIINNTFGIQLAAWNIAMQYDIKTINGYSGNFPGRAFNFFDITSDSYTEEIDRWIDEHNLHNVFAYSFLENEWIPHDSLVSN